MKIILGFLVFVLLAFSFTIEARAENTCLETDLQKGDRFLHSQFAQGKYTRDQLTECLKASKNSPKTNVPDNNREENAWLVKAKDNQADVVRQELEKRSPNPKQVSQNWFYVKGPSERELHLINGVEKVEPNFIYSIFRKFPKPTPRPTRTPTPTLTPTLAPSPSPTPTPTPGSETPNDPYYKDQWDLPWIQVPETWRFLPSLTPLKVAVVDTGCGGILPHPDLTVTDGYDTVNNSQGYADDNGHGTHVAGTIDALTNNNLGIAGINNQTELLCVKALNYAGSGTAADLVEAITWAQNHQAKIINASWGGASFSQAIAEAVSTFQSWGGLFIAARGNSQSNDSLYPALLPNVVSVGATDQNDRLATFSSWGQTTLVAPGVQITSLYMDGVNSPTYRVLSGTSMATPHVVGVASLIWSQSPSISSDEVTNRLAQSADDLGDTGYDPFYGYGRLNAARALGLSPKPVISNVNVSPQVLPASGGTVTINYNLANTDSATLTVGSSTYPLDPSKNSTTATVSANSSSSDQTIPLNVKAVNALGERVISLPSLTIISQANSGKMVYRGEVTTNLQQADDVASTIWPNGLPMIANADYYLGTIGITFQLENGRWGPQTYRSTYVEGGSRNGTVALALEDVSGDQIPDLIGFSRFNGIFIWKGLWPAINGEIFPTQPDVFISSASPDDGTVADINNDGKKDLVWVEANNLYTLTNQGNNSFANLQTISTSILLPAKVEVASADNQAYLVILDYNGTVKIYQPNGQLFATFSTCGYNDLAVKDGSPFTVTVPCGPQTGFDYITVKTDGTYNQQHVQGRTGENWRYSREITVAGAPKVFTSESQNDRLIGVSMANISQILEDYEAGTLPGILERANLNQDGLDDLIGGLAGYVVPAGAPIKIWLQNP